MIAPLPDSLNSSMASLFGGNRSSRTSAMLRSKRPLRARSILATANKLKERRKIIGKSPSNSGFDTPPPPVETDEVMVACGGGIPDAPLPGSGRPLFPLELVGGAPLTPFWKEFPPELFGENVAPVCGIGVPSPPLGGAFSFVKLGLFCDTLN